MSLLIQGAKAGDKPRTPTIAPDDHASISKVKILYALSEGEVKGLVDGAASILLDGTPLVDANGNANFDSVEWEIRHGTVDQTHIAGLPNLSSEIGINTPLRSGTPWVRSVVNTQLSSVNVNLSWSRLSHARDNGDVTGTAVHYAIDVQTDGGGYTTIIDKTIRAKTSGRYQRTHNVPLPDAQQGWQIRVRKITPDGDNTRLFNDMRVDSIAEIIDAKLRYPHTALLYLSFDARTFSSMPKIAVEMYGRYLKVPSNYDAATRTSTGIWDGTFKTAYTNNPAWVYYDLITNDRYGLGDRLKPFMINKWAIAHIARICDEPVDDGKGGTEPRFTCNLYLQKSEQAYQVLQHIAAIFRGMSFWNGSQIVLDADTPRDADYVITRANVVDGAFNKSGTAIDDRHTLVQVAWSNPANNYETDYVTVRNERAIAKYGINPLEMPIVGCTSEGQAYRAGLAALLSEQIRTQTVNFAMGLDGSLPSVGSRVDIADMMFTGANNGGRISAVNADRTVITVDRDDVPATTDDRLTVNLESGRAQTREILSVSGRNITVKAPFDPVAPENVWAVDSDELPTMPFIVLSITENDDRTQYTYSALQYDAGLYPQIDNGTIIEPRPPVPPFNPYIIAAPDDVTIASRHQVNQGVTVTTLIIVWDQVKDAVAYDVEWRKDDGDWIKLPRTGNISIEVDGVYSGNYLARVRAVSAFDAISKPTTSTLTAIAGKVGLPPKVVGLTVTGVLFGMSLKWGFASGSGDADYTEVQVGSAPNVNVATLGQYSYPTNTHTVTGLQGNLSQSYRVRLVDKLGFKSDWSDWVTGTTDANADKVLDLLDGKITESQLYQDLGAKIDKIEQNETAISNETQQRIDDVLSLDNAIGNNATAISNEAQQRINDILVANNALDAEREARIDALTALDEGVSTEIQQLKDADSSTNSRLDTAISKTDDNTAAIASEVTARTNADSALSTRIDTVASKTGDNTAAIAAEQTARTTADTALSSRIDTVSAKTNDNSAAITAETTARTDADSAQVEQINVIKADYKPRYADKTQYADASQSAQWTYWKTVARDNYATNQRITVLQSDVADSNAQITQSLEPLTTKDTALAASIEQLTATTGQNAAAINSEATARTTADSSLSSRIDTLSSKTDSNTSAITSESTARTNADTALSTRIDAAVSKADDNTAAIVSEQETRADADTALTNSITALQSTVDNNTASIATEQTARADADTALASDVTALQSTVGDNTAAISAEATTRANADTALSTRIDTVQSSTATAQSKADKAESDAAAAQTAATNAATLAGNKGEVIYQWQTPAAARQLPQNLWIDTTGGKNTPKRWDGSAWVVVTDKAATDAQTAANAAQSTANDALSKANTATSNIATIQTELSAVTNESSATASAVETLQTTVDGNTSSIQTQQTSIDGINLQYTVKLDSGGKISGFGLINDGATSAFDIRADRFSISAPANGQNSFGAVFTALTSPTEVNGVVLPEGIYLNGDMIATGAISGDKIQANTSITAPTINGGQININNRFMVDSLGNVLAKSGTFEGTVLADQISGTIDVESMKRSAWTPGFRLFIIKDLSAPNNNPQYFDSARQYSSIIPSYGGLSWSSGSGSDTGEIGSAMFEIEVDVQSATTIEQKAFVIDNNLYLFVNGTRIGWYNSQYPDSANGGIITFDLEQGVNKIQYILDNSNADCSVSVLGDFIDNDNVKFA